ncbi:MULTISPECIES: hypothetical protein [unclassified Glutamicibacter]|uniref:hypothetical protein n=1 Tax=unclassified Glutamicibacter TaxID=2627139 RepID=UPI003828180D
MVVSTITIEINEDEPELVGEVLTAHRQEFADRVRDADRQGMTDIRSKESVPMLDDLIGRFEDSQ